MLTRGFLLCVFAVILRAQNYVPLSSAGDDNECALYLSGPARTSAFDYNLNLLRGGSFGYDGHHTCITYDAVNAAYIDARKRINVASPKGDWKTEDIASVGELILDISINLARTYGLTYEEIEKGLPLIDTSKTLIRDVCPPFLAHVECRPGKYRRLDGLCTNLHHPTWGATMTPFQRLIGPLYADGINAPRVSVTGRPLPLSRVVSRVMHPDDGYHDHAGTVMVIAWGQFMDHDYTLTGTPLDPSNRNDPEECCDRPPHAKHPYCNEIRVPDDDYFYRLFNVKCINFVRGFPSPRAGCKLGSRQQFNTLTGVLDGNTVYGVTEKFSRKLRTGYGGLLRMNPVFQDYGLKDLLPLKLDIPDEGCTRPNSSMFCFEAGEIRVNEQLVLTCMHTLMAREHNRVANGLAHVNPHWDDETLFQEARRINIAEIQHITYNEFLPILLGKEVMEKFGLVLQKDGFWDGYDSNVNPNVIDAFAAAAYRFGHSLLPTAVERWSKAHKFIASKRLSDLIRRPYDLYRAGVFDEYIMGLMNQVAQAMDDSITQEVTNHLFKKVGARFGMDLVSFNMQRGREFGVPGYMEFRKFCGLPGADTFQELFGSMPNETIRKYETIFDHPSDVDLWSGGVSERPLPGSMLGPTFACIIATQFSYSRRGDRFWYELPNQPSSFTPEQLTEIRKARLGRIICDNTDIIDTVQVYPMVLPDHEINPRVPCRSGILPSMDFSKWADYSGNNYESHSNPYEKYTKATFSKQENMTTVTNATKFEIKQNATKETSAKPESKIGEEDDTSLSSVKSASNITTLDKMVEAVNKTTGHYKNALRKRRSAEEPLSQNKWRSAIIAEEISGEDVTYKAVVTTETGIPEDMRFSSQPQKFPSTTEHVDYETPNQDYEIPYLLDDDDTHDKKEDIKEIDDLTAPVNKTNIIKNKTFKNETTDSAQDTLDSNDPDFTPEFRLWNSGRSKFLDWLGLGRYNDTDTKNTGNEKKLEELDLSKNKTVNVNVKEQFEFIPLNYSYENSKKNVPSRSNKIITNDDESGEEDAEDDEDNVEDNSKNDEENSVKDDDSESSDEASDENVSARESTQDDDDDTSTSLGDILAELPEIKLPENIFGHYENLKEKKKEDDEENSSKEHAEEESAEESAEDSSEDSNPEEEYEQKPNKGNKNKKGQNYDYEEHYPYPAIDSVTDGPFEKYIHSENRQLHADIVGDPNLRAALAKLIKRTENTEKEAEASGDPKHKYFWTIEYGQPA